MIMGIILTPRGDRVWQYGLFLHDWVMSQNLLRGFSYLACHYLFEYPANIPDLCGGCLNCSGNVVVWGLWIARHRASVI